MKEYFILALLLIFFDAVKPFNIQTTISDGNIELKEPYIKIGENYYIIETTKQDTWLGAVNYCRTKGAHLTSIETEEEFQALTSYLQSEDNGRFWIGANDIDTTFEFFWISSGQPMQYTKWHPDEPNNMGGNERCVVLEDKSEGYMMNDDGCHNQCHYICKAENPKMVSITMW